MRVESRDVLGHGVKSLSHSVVKWSGSIVGSGGGIGFVVSLAVANFGNLLFHAIASREMGPANYGALGTLLAVMLAASLPAAALQVATTKAASAAGTDSPISARRLTMRFAGGAAAAALAVAGASPFVARFLRLDSAIPVMWMAAFIVPAFVATIARGLLFADLRFSAVAVSTIASTATKVALASYVFDAETSLSTATALVFFVESLQAGLLVWHARSKFRRPTDSGQPCLPLAIRWRDTWVSAAAFSGLWAMLAVDLMYARHLLSPTEAGEYIAAATIARAVLFVPQSIALVAHARILRAPPAEVRQILRGALHATVAVSLIVVIIVSTGGPLIVARVFGNEFNPSASLIGTLAITAGLLAITNLFVHHRLAVGLGATSVWLGSAVIAVAASFYLQSPTQIAGAAALGAVVALGLTRPRTAVLTLAPVRDPARRRAVRSADVSVILPVYNAGAAAVEQIYRVAATMAATAGTYELIVVDDGSSDGTDQLLAAVRHPNLLLVSHTRNEGKGAALRTGFDASSGAHVIFLDADRDISPRHIPHYMDLLRLYSADAVIGSKRHPKSRVHYPPLRRLYSVVYQLVVLALFRISVRDTQVGIKVFTRETLLDAMPHTVESGFAFDVELLALAHRVGHRRIVEAPVTIERRFSSTVSTRSVLEMLWSTAAIHNRVQSVNPGTPRYAGSTAAAPARAAAGTGER